MLTHENIWHAIDRLADSFGYSPSGLAKQSGLDATSFNKSKRINVDGKPRWPSTESISRILKATGATMSDFLSLIDSDDNIETRHPKPLNAIPVIGFAQAGSDGYFNEDGIPTGEEWDEVRFPEFDRNGDKHIYALEVSGDSMAPLYREDDILVISPNAPLRRGDRIVVRTFKGEVMVKELIRQTSKQLDLKSLNPAHEDRTLTKDEVDWFGHVIWVSQ